MLELDAVEISSWVSQYVFPFARITGCLAVMPLLGSQLISRRIRIMLAFMMTLVIAPIVPEQPKVDALSIAALVIIAQQLLIGIVLGFLVEIVTQVFVLAGQMIAMQTGLGIATTVDPAQGASVVVVSQWFLFMVSLIFLSLNGHLLVIEILADSFFTMPVSDLSWNAAQLDAVVKWGGWMFASALLISLPALTSLLIVNMAFGVMTRAAPQLNIFALGFPVTMMVGLVIIWLNMGSIATSYQFFLEQLFEFLRKMILSP